jgi:hypothetical protein
LNRLARILQQPTKDFRDLAAAVLAEGCHAELSDGIVAGCQAGTHQAKSLRQGQSV